MRPKRRSPQAAAPGARRRGSLHGHETGERRPDFSPLAAQYARSRPTYPSELFSFLASLVERRHLAWDCATGNGQAARSLAADFEHVVATDLSLEQVRRAEPHNRIDYVVARSEQSALANAEADLVTVASAVHWFELESFYAEVKRVVRPGGIVAAWTYHVGHVDPPFDRVFKSFYEDVVGPYFAPGARLVDKRYETIRLPGEEVTAPDFKVSALWNVEHILEFARSWSGTQSYMEARGADPVPMLEAELRAAWGDPLQVRTLRWPVYLRVARI